MKIDFICQGKTVYSMISDGVPNVSEIVDMADKKGEHSKPHLVSNRIWYPLQDRVEILCMKMGEG